MMPGKKPASATPRRKRNTRKLVSLQTRAMPVDSKPQLSMMRAIQTRAPKRSSAMLLGTSKRK